MSLVTALVGLVLWTPTPSKVSIEAHHGWPGSIRISNGSTELVFVPAIGRVMSFGLVHGPNMLWENQNLRGPASRSTPEWLNVGGDKIWNAPQSDWNWPPDLALDGSLQHATLRKKHLFIRSEPSFRFGIYVEREIWLDNKAPIAHFRNRLVSTRDQKTSIAVWQVTQVNDPDRILVPLEPSQKFPQGFVAFPNSPAGASVHEIEGKNLIFKRNPLGSFKYGTANRSGWLAIDKGGFRFMTRMHCDPSAQFVDNGKAIQWYTNGDPLKYVELELTSPIQLLKKGQSAELDVTWQVERLK